MKIQCPFCGGVDSAPDEFAGKRVICPVCKNKFMAPSIIVPPTPPRITPTPTRKFKCWHCDKKFEIDPEDQSVLCPHCGAKIDRPERIRRFSEIRQELLERIEGFEELRIPQVRWVSGNDKAVCSTCKRRNGKIMTIAKAKATLEGTFCRCDGFEQSCRCLVVPVIG